MKITGTRVWNTILDGLLVIAIAIPAGELLMGISALALQHEYLLLYFAAFLLAGSVLGILEKERYILRLLPVLPVVVLGISMDLILFSNAIFALFLYAAAYLILQTSIRKWILSGLVILLLVSWLIRGDMPGYVAACLILAGAGTVSEFLKGEGRKNYVILIAITAALAILVPSKETPIRWEGIRQLIARTGEYIDTAWKNVNYFFSGLFNSEDTAYSGYAENGSLMGKTVDSPTEELYFSGADRQPEYLVGARYARLTPQGFPQQLDTEKVNSWLAMYLSALSENDCSREKVSCFSKSERANITFAYIRTSDLLIPATVFNIRNDLKFGLSETKKKGFAYDFHYYVMDTANPYYRDLIYAAEQNPARADYQTAEKTAKELCNITLSAYLSEEEYLEALRRADEVETDEDYLDSSMATDKIRTLAEELTSGADRDLDKALRIEAYLRQYEYDTSVDLRGRDNYVESFLFEIQRGYCVHFASSMVLLLRSVGIPARYVQGFIYRPNDQHLVKGTDAHAWVEAYMSGFGWVRFEPTPVAENAEAYAWGLRVREKEEGSGEGEKEKEKEEEEYIPPEIPKAPEGVLEEETGASFGEILRTIGLYLGGILLLVGLILAVILILRRIRYRRLPPEMRLREDMTRLRKRLDLQLPEGVSVVSVPEYLPFVEDKGLRDQLEGLFRGYYRVRFRGDPADPDLLTQMDHCLKLSRKKKQKKDQPVPEPEESISAMTRADAGRVSSDKEE